MLENFNLGSLTIKEDLTGTIKVDALVLILKYQEHGKSAYYLLSGANMLLGLEGITTRTHRIRYD